MGIVPILLEAGGEPSDTGGLIKGNTARNFLSDNVAIGALGIGTGSSSV